MWFSPRRKLLLAPLLLVPLVASVSVGRPAAAGGKKHETVAVCHHHADRDAWKKIFIDPDELDAHLDHHDDALPDDITTISDTPLDSFCELTQPPCGDCLNATPGQVGCEIPECEAAVCDGEDPYCCGATDGTWDGECVAFALDLCVTLPIPPLCRM